ncbi:uncharacterized protein [Venturia canescens]|uniref:uncharacterized protein n=1 Tax=Venturia canescens TaxID=32260 RepID=UPI001C9CF798|nr:uncharacterized protein LOC122409736 [Venturia canescens]
MKNRLSGARLVYCFFFWLFFFRQNTGDEIISGESLLAVKESIKFLKRNARAEGLFRRTGRLNMRRRMLNALKKGRVENFQHAHRSDALECAAALQLFIIRLKKPVVPFNVQRLMLAENPGIAAQDIARDALGLIRQDVGGRHGELLADILELLSFLARSAPPSECSELQGSPLPIVLLPVFFRMTAKDLITWQRIASRFKELITGAPETLTRNSRPVENENGKLMSNLLLVQCAIV